MAFWIKESVKRVIQNILQKKKGHIFFISKIFHMTSTVCLVKSSLWASASPYFDSVCLDSAEGIWTHTHYWFWSLWSIIKKVSRWFNSGGFPPRFGVFSQCERRYSYVKGCTLGASPKSAWDQCVTYLAHSMKHVRIVWLSRSSYLSD